jgi:hypothetical protein
MSGSAVVEISSASMRAGSKTLQNARVPVKQRLRNVGDVPEGSEARRGLDESLESSGIAAKML